MFVCVQPFATIYCFIFSGNTNMHTHTISYLLYALCSTLATICCIICRQKYTYDFILVVCFLQHLSDNLLHNLPPKIGRCLKLQVRAACVYVCLHVCMYTFMDVMYEMNFFMYVCMYVFKCIYTRRKKPVMYVRLYVCMYVCMHVCMCVRMHVYSMPDTFLTYTCT